MELFGFELSTAWFLATFAVILGYIYLTWNYSIFTKAGVPGPKPWPVFGNAVDIYRKGYLEFQRNVHNKYGAVVGTFEGRCPVLLVKDPAMMKQIMVKEFSSFTNRRDSANDHPLDLNVSALRDGDWRRVRSLMTPAFSSGKLKKMTTAINECCDIMVANFQKEDQKTGIEIRKVTNAFAMDVICRIAFGLQVDSQNNPNDRFVLHARRIIDFRPVWFLLANAFPRVARFLQKTLALTITPKDTMEFFHQVVDETIRQRQKEATGQVDMFHLMMKANEIEPDRADIEEDQNIGFHYEASGKGKKALSRDELMGNSLVFFVAGSETTASTISYLLFSLATNPDIQERVVKEIDEVLGNETVIGPEHLSKLEYLDMCLQETLRMYPVAIRTERSCSQDVTIKGIKIKKGTTVAITIYEVQHDPANWPEPDKFDPERFSPKAKESRNPMTWIPFGFGPRNCIGMRLALMELKIAAAKLLQNFTFRTCPETEVPIKFSDQILLSPLNPVKLTMDRRD